jgi:hypothetical protein
MQDNCGSVTVSIDPLVFLEEINEATAVSTIGLSVSN